MNIDEYFKHLLIRSPFEKPALKLRSLLDIKHKIYHPELLEIYLETSRIESIMKLIIHQSSNCIDIGCHLGSTLSKILELSPNGNHMAFEPIPYKAQWLKRKFPEVNVLQIALGDRKGEVQFYENLNRSGYSGLRPHNKKDKDKVLQYNVELKPLDEIFNFSSTVDFIKIDVEGNELQVLRGASKLLYYHRPILLFECTKSGLTCFNFTSLEVFELLNKKHQYSVFLPKDFLHDGEALDFQQFDKAMQYPFKALNFIAIPQHSNKI